MTAQQVDVVNHRQPSLAERSEGSGLDQWVLEILADPVTKLPASPRAIGISDGVIDARRFMNNTSVSSNGMMANRTMKAGSARPLRITKKNGKSMRRSTTISKCPAACSTSVAASGRSESFYQKKPSSFLLIPF